VDGREPGAVLPATCGPAVIRRWSRMASAPITPRRSRWPAIRPFVH